MNSLPNDYFGEVVKSIVETSRNKVHKEYLRLFVMSSVFENFVEKLQDKR